MIGRALAGTAGERPLHHRFPVDGGWASRRYGRGTPARGRMGMALLRTTENVPKPMLRAAMTVLKPPSAPKR